MDTTTASRRLATICAAFLFVFGFKILMLARSDALMNPASSPYGAPSRGGPGVDPPPGYVPRPLPPEPYHFGLYPFIGVVPMESVGAAIAVVGTTVAPAVVAWLGVLVLVVFSVGHTVVDWAAIAVLAGALIVSHVAAIRSRA